MNHKSLQIVLAFAIVFVGLIVILLALWMPPLGVIDPSVLAAFGEILTFSGAIIGIDYRYRYRK